MDGLCNQIQKLVFLIVCLFGSLREYFERYLKPNSVRSCHQFIFSIKFVFFVVKRKNYRSCCCGYVILIFYLLNKESCCKYF